jgi:hypothetical protein
MLHPLFLITLNPIEIQSHNQGCQMVSFKIKNPNLGKFWRALEWKMLISFMAFLNILQTFRKFYDHLVHFVFIWYIFSVLVTCTKKNLATLLTTQSFSIYTRWQAAPTPLNHAAASGSGANPTIVSYNDSAVKIYNASSSLVRI